MLLDQKQKILEKLTVQAAVRSQSSEKQSCQTEMILPVLAHLQHVFQGGKRINLSTSILDSKNNPDFVDLRILSEKVLLSGAQEITKAPAELLCLIGRRGYNDDTDTQKDDGDRTQMSFFKPVLKTTAKDYARRLSSFLVFSLSLVNNERILSDCGIQPRSTVLSAIRRFKTEFENDPTDANNLIKLLLVLLNQVYTKNEDYNSDLCCSFVIGQLFDCSTGEFTSKESANKTLSAFKYCMRMAALLAIMESDDSYTQADDCLISRVQWKRYGEKSTFKQLVILQAGVNSLPRKLHPAAMVLDVNCERISYDGIPCSFDLLHQILHTKMKEAEKKISKLLMGFKQKFQRESESYGYSSVPFSAYYAFGQNSESEYGDLSLFHYVLDNPQLKKHFFGVRRVSVKRDQGRAYLKLCQDYEKVLVVIMHILFGCGPRATDYKSMTFMNGCVESKYRTVSIYDSDYIHCTMKNNKCTLLHGKSEAFSTFLPRKIADYTFGCYWKYVRPFALVVKESLGGTQSFERWKRYCFVQACDEKWVREAIRDSFAGNGIGCNFQWLRHSANFLLNMFVKGTSFSHSLPVFRLFGHSPSTDACYGVEKLSGFDNLNCTNTTAVRIIQEKYWEKVGLEQRRDHAENDESDHGCDSEDESEDDCSYSGDESDDFGHESNSENDSEDDYVHDESDGENNEGASDSEDESEEGCVHSSDENDVPYQSEDIESAEECVFLGDKNDEYNSDTEDESAAEEFHPISSNTESKPDCFTLTSSREEEDQVDPLISSDDAFGEELESFQLCDTQVESNQDDVTFDRETQSLVLQTVVNESLIVSRPLEMLGLAQYKSQGQKKLVEEVMHGSGSVLGVLPTGGGKSLAMFSCLYLDKRAITLIIFPLVSVMLEIKSRLESLSAQQKVPEYKYVLWGARKDSSAEEMLRVGTRLVLASAEHLQDKRFQTFIQQAGDGITAVIFDEAHLFTTSAFRKNLSLIPLYIRSLTAAKFVLLSATVPCYSEKLVLKKFGISDATTIRTCTIAPNIVHVVKHVQEYKISTASVAPYLTREEGSSIVFVKSKVQCEELSQQLNQLGSLQSCVTHYHADLDLPMKEKAYREWKSGSKRVIVATTAFAMGVDSSKCNLVIHVDAAFNLETYFQAAGRAGRSGQRAWSIILLSKGALDRIDDHRLSSFLRNTSDCRRVLLSRALDAPETLLDAKCGYCDNCKHLQFDSVPFDATITRDNVLISQGFHSCEQEKQSAVQRITAAKHIALKVKSLLDKHITGKQCFICSAMKLPAAFHSLNQCPQFRNRCFRCGDRHKRSDCEVEKSLSRICSRNAVCVTCFTPCNSLVASFHHGNNTMGRNCRFRDTIVPACMVLWQYKKLQVLDFIRSRDATRSEEIVNTVAYTNWLCEVNDGITNSMALLHQMIH